MADADYTFAQARARLEDIVGQVRKKDMSLEGSLDLLEEGVRLANACTEHIDHTEWRAAAGQQDAETGADATPEVEDGDDAEMSAETPDADPGTEMPTVSDPEAAAEV